MSIKRYNAMRDANEPELVQLAEQLGAKVWRLDTPCDLLVLIRGQWFPVEIKTAKGKLTKPQRDFLEEADRAGGDVLIWRSTDDVLEAFKIDGTWECTNTRQREDDDGRPGDQLQQDGQRRPGVRELQAPRDDARQR